MWTLFLVVGVGGFIHAAVGSFGGVGGALNRLGLAA